MATVTMNYGLIITDGSENISIYSINENFSTIDRVAGANSNASALGLSTLGYTRKNYLQTKPLTFTKFGITATVNADGTITLDGTNTSGAAYILLTNLRVGGTVTAMEYDNYRLLPPGEYILSGGSSDGGARIQLRLSEEPDSLGDVYYSTSATGEDVRFMVTDAQQYSYTKLYIGATAAFDNVTIYPMIRDARISDDSYEPYRQSVEERLAALEAFVAAQAVTE